MFGWKIFKGIMWLVSWFIPALIVMFFFEAITTGFWPVIIGGLFGVLFWFVIHGHRR